MEDEFRNILKLIFQILAALYGSIPIILILIEVIRDPFPRVINEKRLARNSLSAFIYWSLLVACLTLISIIEGFPVRWAFVGGVLGVMFVFVFLVIQVRVSGMKIKRLKKYFKLFLPRNPFRPKKIA